MSNEAYACPNSECLDFGGPVVTRDYNMEKGFARVQLPKGSLMRFNGRRCKLDDMYCAFWNRMEIAAKCPKMAGVT